MKRTLIAAIVGAAAAALFIAGAASQTGGLVVSKTGEDATTLTLGWQPVEGAAGYRFSREGDTRRSHTWDVARDRVRFGKGSAWYRVESLLPGPEGTWPPAVPPPPPPPPPPANVLYVSPSGSDASPCTKAQPCQSPETAATRAPAGGVVEMADGNYPANWFTIDYRGVTIRAAAGANPTFTTRAVFRNSSNLTVIGTRFLSTDPLYDLFIDACNTNLRFENTTGHVFLMLEGNNGITFKGGDWGDYKGRAHDSGIGNSSADPTKRRWCAGASGPAPTTRNVLIDGTRFHDVEWGTPQSQWGGHPDCFQLYGGVDGLTIRNAVFERCGNTWIGAYADFGDILNTTIENTTFRDIGDATYYAMQFQAGPGSGKGWECGNLVLRGNTWLPNNPNGLDPYSGIRILCTPRAGTQPALVEGNTFQEGPPANVCAQMLAAPFNSTWRNNTFSRPPSCEGN